MSIVRKLLPFLLFLFFAENSKCQKLTALKLQAGVNVYSFQESPILLSDSYEKGNIYQNFGGLLGLGTTFKFKDERFGLAFNFNYFRDKLLLKYIGGTPPNSYDFERYFINNVLQNQFLFVLNSSNETFSLRLGMALDYVLNTSSTDQSSGTSYDHRFIYGGEGERFNYFQIGPQIGFGIGNESFRVLVDYFPGVTPRYITGKVESPYYPNLDSWDGQKMGRSMWAISLNLRIMRFDD